MPGATCRVNLLILHTQVPFVRGGAEVLVDGLADALRRHGHDVDTVALPLSWNPPERLLTTALAWRLLDLRRFNYKQIDRVICTKFPTWAVEHDQKALWLIHQHRQAYDLFGTALSEFDHTPESSDVRRRVLEIDRVGIGTCAWRFAISRNVSERLKRGTGLDATPLYPPVPRDGLRPEAFHPFVLSVARLDRSKRVLPLIEAWPEVDARLTLRIAGDGPDRRTLERRARQLGVDGRIEFLGRVSDEALGELYNTCRAVYYAPIDEDYGYTAVEALAAGKPVIAAPDSGGVLEFVTDEVTGLVTTLDRESLSGAVNRLADEALARLLGSPGPALTAGLTWDRVVDALTGGPGNA
jgi:glycosyltransferase involved in cell wall biosynthesis